MRDIKHSLYRKNNKILKGGGCDPLLSVSTAGMYWFIWKQWRYDASAAMYNVVCVGTSVGAIFSSLF